jgi:hypothetical protein
MDRLENDASQAIAATLALVVEAQATGLSDPTGELGTGEE